MEYYFRIQKAIDYIEDNLGEEMSITEISSKAYFSAFHFQRIFQAILGFSVKGYIRSRRLSEAAILLKETDYSILQIAVDFQYGSQEAFTRAFQKQFSVTPASYRKVQVKSVSTLKRIDLLEYKGKMQGDVNVDKPEIVWLPKTHIVGYEYKTDLNDEKYFEDIANYYSDFGINEYYLKIPERIAPAFPYGISCNYRDDGRFSFVIGESVEHSATELDSGFVNMEIPEGKYAEFKVTGSVGIAQNTWRYIYGTWLANSNYKRREGPDFEVTDVCNSVYPDKMLLRIYIPVE